MRSKVVPKYQEMMHYHHDYSVPNSSHHRYPVKGDKLGRRKASNCRQNTMRNYARIKIRVLTEQVKQELPSSKVG